MHKRAVRLLIILTVAWLLSACNRKNVYAHFRHVPVSGWEKNDTINFQVPAIMEEGEYSEEIGLRIDSDFPFQRLTLIVHQTVLPSGFSRNDTLDCQLIDSKGYHIGKGIANYQYSFLLNTFRLNKGDSLRVSVRHNMKSEILFGVSDIGFRLDKQ